MTNKEKAKEIANIYRDRMLQMSQICDNDWLIIELVNDVLEWKDEQHTKEKQQWIEEACRYIKKNVCEHINHNPLYKDYKHEEVIGFQLVVDEQFYIDFKKEMEE